MDTPEISVYGEAKGEYTRQLCVFLLPCLETYILELLETAKREAPNSQKVLWHFQSLLQSIPDWNQDKVIRETDKIQKDCRCDYLEELLTAVFIAHTKVLSAIRLTTKQKKLQITIPKLDHFLHRVLVESARTLWTNAYLFADTNSIEKQKNLRQVSALLQEAILQAIRGLLPVKSILREYLHEDEDEEEEVEKKEIVENSSEETHVPEQIQISEETQTSDETSHSEEISAPEQTSHSEETQDSEEIKASEEVRHSEETPSLPQTSTPTEIVPTTEPPKESSSTESSIQEAPMIYIETKPSVSFTQEHILFDSNSLEENKIQDFPFAEAELRPPEEEEEDEIDTLEITDEILPMDAEELLP